MRSELRFFMHPSDEEAFVAHVKGMPQVTLDLTAGSTTYLRGQFALAGNDGLVQFARSKIVGNVLTEGRLAIATTGFGLEDRLPKELIEAEGVRASEFGRLAAMGNLTLRIYEW